MRNFNFVVEILNFGFLGLSFLMLFLAYRLVKFHPQKVGTGIGSLTMKFMNLSLAFMILAGPLQWVTIAVKNYVEDKKVNLNVGLNTTIWEDTFGKIYIRSEGEFIPLTRKSVKKVFKEDEEILINVGEVIEAIGLMRKQIELLNNENDIPQEYVLETLEEG